MAFSFGGAPAQPAASSSFSFGGASTQNNQSATGTGTSLFGNNNTSTLGQSTGGGLFGAKPAATTGATGGGLFGSSQQPAQPASSSLFGAPAAQQNQQPQQSGGLFGSTLGNNSTSLFGPQQQQQQQQPQQQQQQQQQPLQQSTLNSSTLGILGPSQNQNRSSLFASVSGSSVPKKRTLQERLQKIASGVIDPAQSELRSYVYYAAPASNGQEHQWPGDQYISKQLFDEAQRHNPNRSALLPIQLKGYEAMKQRVEIQVKHQADQRTYFDALQGQLNSAYQEITQSLSLSQDKLAAQSARVFSLLVKYVADFALLVRTVKGSDLTRQEEETYKLLKEVLKAYEITGNGGRMEGKLAEFWACILRLKQVVDSGYASNGKFDWSLESEQDLLRIFKEQGKALTALRNVAQDQKFDVDTLEKGLPLVV
ncbi:hypothetical protein FFLO_00174 [Filobasidium floriforme]|uniref:Nucleoporin Nup54 alpha-helical domain-containing protein n=1 Tax=Filobasidium floriforme TaxID=5210 RepID=A0A8K0JTG9_9TREE|nr:uncharacterized protein HD553DRAFT_348845 [Filobasidium floriforme]KAG7579966.1 hypothetical protein FFLO_00174 [Filobasidium floriforme]KAH8087365.1 hypothetical protein HD553DRAFT_348845 [Filobasidium floriforme]